MLFARRAVDRFAETDWHLDHGLPRLLAAPGWIVCELARSVEGGDHRLLLGTVTHAVSTPAAPLVYSHRTFGTHSGFDRRPRKPITDHIHACAQ